MAKEAKRAPETPRTATKADSGVFWLLLDHDKATVVEGERPSIPDRAKGERTMAVRGPFEDRDEAQRQAGEYTGMTVKGWIAQQRGNRK